MVHSPGNVKENHQHALCRVSDLTHLLQSYRLWALPLFRLMFALWLIVKSPVMILYMCGTF